MTVPIDGGRGANPDVLAGGIHGLGRASLTLDGPVGVTQDPDAAVPAHHIHEVFLDREIEHWLPRSTGLANKVAREGPDLGTSGELSYAGAGDNTSGVSLDYRNEHVAVGFDFGVCVVDQVDVSSERNFCRIKDVPEILRRQRVNRYADAGGVWR